MLVLDETRADRSYVAERSSAYPATVRDPDTYPAEYVDGDWKVYTRFERGRGTRTFLDEEMYGHWIPGDARAALLGVIIGGPYSTVRELLSGLTCPIDLLDGESRADRLQARRPGGFDD